MLPFRVMGLLSRIRENGQRRRMDREVALQESLVEHRETLQLYQERLAELELAQDDEGWRLLGMEGEREFSRGGLDKIIRLARLMYLKNPLIRRAIAVQSYYVFGQGVSISGPTDAVNEVIQAWLDDPGNRAVLTGHQARSQREVDLQTDGSLFFSLFTDRSNGRVKVRMINVDEIREIITNPEDRLEPWFYYREWEQRTFVAETGSWVTERRKAYYPDWRYGGTMPATLGGEVVEEDIPVMHVKVGGTGSMRFGVPDVYAALDWARAYKDWLSDWATIARSLARWAWKFSGKAKQLAGAKTKINTTLGTGDGAETNPPPATGSVAFTPDGSDLIPIPKTGAHVSADDGLQLRKMVASATDTPDTILGSDPDMGNLATAKTLDRPTELAMKDRQTLWADVYKDLVRYVIEQSLRAPDGALSGSIEERHGLPVMLLDPEPAEDGGPAEPQEAKVDVVFPPILEDDVLAIVDAIVRAATLAGNPTVGTIPKETLTRMLLSALGEQDVDARLEELKEEMGEGDEEEEGEPAPIPEMEERFVEALLEFREAVRGLKER